ncbi:MAG: hypothetical protein JXA04_05155 [Gammaproteobacteria bacterium]|nr:hypothetical protein [Gammaproteobacteria bacterium]
MSRLLSTEQSNIPVLTEVVKSSANRIDKNTADADKKDPPKPEPTLKSSIEAGGVDRPRLEKLIYKTLHQNLSQLCQHLADDIIAELNSESRADTEKSSKSRSRR